MEGSEILDQQFKNVSDELTSISKRTREIQDNFKILQKTIRTVEKQVKQNKKKSQVKMHLIQVWKSSLVLTRELF